PALPSFPTRRSSDLPTSREAEAGVRRRVWNAVSNGSILSRLPVLKPNVVVRTHPNPIVCRFDRAPVERIQAVLDVLARQLEPARDRKSTRLNSSHVK